MARLPPSRHPLHCGLRIPDLRARDDSPLRGSCHHALPAICLTRRLPAQRIRRCGLNATFRTRLQQCDGDWSPLSPRCYRVAHAARLGTDTEICDTVRLCWCCECQFMSTRPRDRANIATLALLADPDGVLSRVLINPFCKRVSQYPLCSESDRSAALLRVDAIKSGHRPNYHLWRCDHRKATGPNRT